jgi:hypothetical protein
MTPIHVILSLSKDDMDLYRKGNLLMKNVLLSVCFALAASGPVPAPAESPLVVKVDHIVVRTEFPEQLFLLMTDELGLPVAWPLAFYPGFTTGGVHAGNVNIEFLRLDGQSLPDTAASLYGIVFEPTSAGKKIAELKNRGADPGKPEAQYSNLNGKPVRMWTNIMLNGLCRDDYIVYLVDYSPEAASHLSSRASAVGGPMGRIGLRSMKEIVITTADIKKTGTAWHRFLNPAGAAGQDTWRIGKGPAIRLVAGHHDKIRSMVWEVESLKEARAILAGVNMLGDCTAEGISLDRDKIHGLDIKLVER